MFLFLHAQVLSSSLHIQRQSGDQRITDGCIWENVPTNNTATARPHSLGAYQRAPLLLLWISHFKKTFLLGLILQLKYFLHCEAVCAITWTVCYHIFCCFHQDIIRSIEKLTLNVPTCSCSNTSSFIGVSMKMAVSSIVVVQRHATLPYGSTYSSPVHAPSQQLLYVADGYFLPPVELHAQCTLNRLILPNSSTWWNAWVTELFLCISCSYTTLFAAISIYQGEGVQMKLESYIQ